MISRQIEPDYHLLLLSLAPKCRKLEALPSMVRFGSKSSLVSHFKDQLLEALDISVARKKDYVV